MKELTSDGNQAYSILAHAEETHRPYPCSTPFPTIGKYETLLIFLHVHAFCSLGLDDERLYLWMVQLLWLDVVWVLRHFFTFDDN